MDGSGSIGSCEFENGKKAMKPLMEHVQPNLNAKYAMVTFASGVRKDFGFLPQLVAASKIESVTFPSGSTNTQAGLAQALNMFKGTSVEVRCPILLLVCCDINMILSFWMIRSSLCSTCYYEIHKYISY